jgi:hypothetical protein
MRTSARLSPPNGAITRRLRSDEPAAKAVCCVAIADALLDDEPNALRGKPGRGYVTGLRHEAEHRTGANAGSIEPGFERASRAQLVASARDGNLLAGAFLVCLRSREMDKQPVCGDFHIAGCAVTERANIKADDFTSAQP